MAGLAPSRWLEEWVNRRRRPATHAQTLDRRRIYILPSGFGLVYALMVIVLLLWSTNYNNNMGFAMTFLLAAVGLNGMWAAHANLLGLVVHPPGADPVFAHQTALWRVRLDNTRPLSRVGISLSAAGAGPVAADLPAQGSVTLDLTLPAGGRGWWRLGRLRLETRYPLGLFLAWSWLEFDRAVLVYPRPLGDRPLPAVSAGAAAASGAVGAGADDYSGLRGYVPGDSPRHIAWKASLRGDTLYVKTFTGSARLELWLDWEALPDLPPEARLSQLTQWVLKAETEGLEYGLRLPGRELPPGAGAGHRRRCLEALALHGQSDITGSP